MEPTGHKIIRRHFNDFSTHYDNGYDKNTPIAESLRWIEDLIETMQTEKAVLIVDIRSDLVQVWLVNKEGKLEQVERFTD